MSSWWTNFFDDDYAAYGLANDPPELIDRIVNFLISTLELKAGDCVFDQCCGIGRLSLPLARRGIRVIGVDQATSYIERANREAAAGGWPCSFRVGDAFEFVAAEPCDAAFNWFTSFAYCAEDAQNIRMLQRAFESLKPGGRFALDYLNIPRVIADFRPAIVDRPTAIPGLIVIHEARPHFDTGMLDSQWTFLYADGRRDQRLVSTKMYFPHEIVQMMRCCGFDEVKVLGSADGEPFERTSRRCIVTAKKPA